MEALIVRRMRTLDALILIAATATALVPASALWHEALAVFRKVDLTHLREHGFGGTIFATKTQTARMDSMT